MLPVAIRRFSCNPVVRGIANRLHVSHLARRVYCSLLSSDGDLKVSTMGVDVVFKTHDSNQLSFVDYILTTEMGFVEAALKDLKKGDTFLDVGCHYGIFSILASKLVGPTGRVISVEPHAESLEIFRQNIAANNCKNIEVLNIAFTDRTRRLALENNVHCTVVRPSSDPATADHSIQGMAGDEALEGLPVPVAVKIDVEGHESAALNGLTQTFQNPACRRLCIEIHPPLLPADVKSDDIKNLILGWGFRILDESDRSSSLTSHLVVGR
jgi:FkbM family methyltransferase